MGIFGLLRQSGILQETVWFFSGVFLPLEKPYQFMHVDRPPAAAAITKLQMSCPIPDPHNRKRSWERRPEGGAIGEVLSSWRSAQINSTLKIKNSRYNQFKGLASSFNKLKIVLTIIFIITNKHRVRGPRAPPRGRSGQYTDEPSSTMMISSAKNVAWIRSITRQIFFSSL